MPNLAKTVSVLFVSEGGVCRSPAAEAIFGDLVRKRSHASKFNIDSAGLTEYHEGCDADPRMILALKYHNIEIKSWSKPIKASDFSNFDLILVMDKSNEEDLLNIFQEWKTNGNLPADADGGKIKLISSYFKKYSDTEVLDPYYGGFEDFYNVVDLLKDACESLLDSLLSLESITEERIVGMDEAN